MATIEPIRAVQLSIKAYLEDTAQTWDDLKDVPATGTC